jgi:hypothetical protein
MNRTDEWVEIYEANLIKVVTEHPDLYEWPLSQVHMVAEKMRIAFENGSFNKDSLAIRATCKHFGIKFTYAAIKTFLRG